MTESLCDLSAEALVALLSAREISAHQAVQAHIARLEEVNDALNALVVPRFDAALEEADRVDAARAAGEPVGILAGLPVTVKECLDVAGLPSTVGLQSRREHRAGADETHVARLRAAGAVVLGKTNVAQFLAFLETDNPVYGRTNNPWNAGRTPGGSSGGEAAVIAAGGSALGLGTDIGGSSRNPAAFCGICGFKPSSGRLPDTSEGSFAPPPGTIGSEVGVLARTVADVALALRTVNGDMPLADPDDVDVTRLRTAVVTSDHILEPSPAARRAVDEAGAALRAAGGAAEPWELPGTAAGLGLGFAVLGFDRLAHFVDLAEGTAIDPRVKQLRTISNMPAAVRRVAAGVLSAVGQPGLAAGMRLLSVDGSDAGLARTTTSLEHYRAAFAAALDAAGFDAILLPASPLPAVPHGATKNLGTLGAYTMLWNVLGYPAGVVPWTTVRADEERGRAKSRDVVAKTARDADLGSAGLPIGVQVVGRPGRDHEVLALMRTLEAASLRQGQHPGRPEPPGS